MDKKTIYECKSCGYTTASEKCDVCQTSRYLIKVRKNKGFTLIEVLIVTMIISILTMLIVPNVIRAKIEANHASVKSTLSSLAKMLEIYYIENSQYPTNINKLFKEEYILVDYFKGEHRGYIYVGESYANAYIIIAQPVSDLKGKRMFTLSTGGKMN